MSSKTLPRSGFGPDGNIGWSSLSKHTWSMIAHSQYEPPADAYWMKVVCLSDVDSTDVFHREVSDRRRWILLEQPREIEPMRHVGTSYANHESVAVIMDLDTKETVLIGTGGMDPHVYLPVGDPR